MWKLRIGEGNGDAWLMSVNNHVGRQHWEFDPLAGTLEERLTIERLRREFTQNRFQVKQSSDLLMRMQLTKENPSRPIPPTVKVNEIEDITEKILTCTLRRAVGYYTSIQAHDGHWPAESAGPLFFLPILVMALYVTGVVNVILSPEHQKELKRYIYNHQNDDGGWGLHIEGHSTMYGSILNYIALRLLGEGAENLSVARGRRWILDHGGAVATPSLGKAWLAILGVYEWSGCTPMPPEIWLLPNISPIHLGKMLIFFRLTYLPLSYLYGKRFVGQITELIVSLRKELYNEIYNDINWNQARKTVAKEDLYYPHSPGQDMLFEFIHRVCEPILSRWPFYTLREKALKKAIELVHYEDINSRYCGIGSAIKFLCLVACWVEDPTSDAYKYHLARIPDHYWIAEDGLKIQSFGSQMWDTSLAIQAIIASNLINEYGPTLRKAHEFVKDSQVRENPSGDFTQMHRHISKGAWTFSIQDQGWQVSDCTAEGLKAALILAQMSPQLVGPKMETERFYDAVNFILSLQNKNGGFSAWEPQRAPSWLEKFNPTEFFEDTLFERGYVECTTSAIQGLAMFKKLHPNYRRKEIDSSISKALRYIEDTQNSDGSWYGCWGICYTYGTWFAIEGLVACGKTYDNSLAVRKACDFLLSKQLPCGGWGESYLSSQNKVYTNLQGNRSHLVQTAWALLSLIQAGQGKIDPTPIHRGVRILINSQMEDGDFPQQEITGVFMKNCILHYASHRNIFPIWALAEYRRHVLFADTHGLT